VVGLVAPRGAGSSSTAPTISGLRGGAPGGRERRRGHVQLVFQDPLRSLDPDLTVGEIVGEGLGSAAGRPPTRSGGVADALGKVGLDADPAGPQPGQISGGQRQRVSIARALATDPRLLLCDEPVSALDASNRNYILRLLGELRDSLGLPIVIISHDLSSLAGIADRVVVLYRGRIVEDGPVEQVFAAPRHPVHGAADGLRAERPKHDRPLSVHQLRRTDADPRRRPARTRACSPHRCPVRGQRLRGAAGARDGRERLGRRLPSPRGVGGTRPEGPCDR
jgi:ABC-type glutathione transport system ATPase component